MGGIAEKMVLWSFLATSAQDRFQEADEHAFAVAPLTEPGFSPNLNRRRKITFRMSNEDNEIGARCLVCRSLG